MCITALFYWFSRLKKQHVKVCLLLPSEGPHAHTCQVKELGEQGAQDGNGRKQQPQPETHKSHKPQATKPTKCLMFSSFFG